MSLEVHIEKKLNGFTLRSDLTAGNTATAILGASGCGKSMTLRCIAGIVKPDKGRILLDGRVLFDSEQHIDLPPQQRGVGLLFQNYALFPNMTVEQNILCGLNAEKDRAARKARCAGMLREPFAVINADDFYGAETFRHLAEHLSKPNLSGIPAHHCMVGFRAGNTLTENGTVSRGVCEVGEDGRLIRVTERTKVEKRGRGAAYLDDDGTTWTELPFDTIVSMNCWGFTPDLFRHLETELRGFYEAAVPTNPLKCEFYLPFAVQAQMEAGLCDVAVYPTESVWQGVTYQEDKPHVKAAIADLIANGEYPADLWA